MAAEKRLPFDADIGSNGGMFVHAGRTAIALWVAIWTMACAAEVNLGDETSQGNTTSAGSAEVDPRCFDACIAAGGSEDACTKRCCTDNCGAGQSGAGGNATSSGGNANASTSSGQGGDGGLGQAMAERNCFACLEENASACPGEHAACEANLACSVLKKCPFECFEDTTCIEQCKAIVPDGVAPLTKLIDCMVCNGPPCKEACTGSVMFKAYCL